MALIISGLIIFIGMHSLPSVTGARTYLVERLGQLPYKGLFALLSLIGFGLIVAGMLQPAHEPLWAPPGWARTLPYLVMPLVFVLLAAAYLPNRIRRLTPHPMLWGVVLWSLVHLSANSTPEALLLFGGFGMYSLYAIQSMNHRGKIKVLPEAGWRDDLVVVCLGLIAFAVCLYVHPGLQAISFAGHR